MYNTAVSMARSWITGKGFKFADHKNDVLLISSRKRMEFVTITVSSQCLISKQMIKNLDVVIDSRRTFREHLT